MNRKESDKKRIAWIVGLAALVFAILIAGVWLFGKSEEEKKDDVRAVLLQWDGALKTTSDLWTQAAQAENRYVELNMQLTQAYSAGDTGGISGLVPQARESLNEQSRLLAEIEGSIAARGLISRELATVVENLPERDYKQKLEEVVINGLRSNELMRDAVDAYRRQLDLEHQILNLFSSYALGETGDSDFVMQFNDIRGRSNEAGRLADERFSQASDLEQGTIGASTFLDQP